MTTPNDNILNAPTLDEQHGDATGYDIPADAVDELNAWYDAHAQPFTDEELEAWWLAEQAEIEAQREIEDAQLEERAGNLLAYYGDRELTIAAERVLDAILSEPVEEPTDDGDRWDGLSRIAM